MARSEGALDPAAAFRAEARTIAEDSDLKDCLFLVSRGVPFDVAFSLDEAARFAWCVILGELGGGHFDWNTGRWTTRTD